MDGEEVTTWSGGIAEWIEKDIAYISAVFSWNAQKAFMRCCYYKQLGYHIRVGGQVVYQYPEMFSAFDISGSVNALVHHNPDATLTSRGCIRNCSFCLVPKVEGDLIELDDWENKPIISDNNLLACSIQHFDKVIDKLLENKTIGIDFNGGLDVRILTDHHTKRLSKLPKDTILRLAWDNVRTERLYLSAVNKLIDAGIKPNQIRTYVLIGYQDTPEDAKYRLEKVRSLGLLPSPMRYHPLDAKKKNDYVGEDWTQELLTDYMRYYARLNWFDGFDFDEYNKKVINYDKQGVLL